MVYIEKSTSVPSCLESEKSKKSGDYKCGDVLTLVKNDFHNKCYICGTDKPTTINIEHFIPHKGDLNLKFDWNNLFWSCGHCNNTKLDKYNNILNCTKIKNIDELIKYKCSIKGLEATVLIEATENSPNDTTVQTINLLNDVYTGTTKLKKIESENILTQLKSSMKDLSNNYIEYKFADTEEDQEFWKNKLKKHILNSSPFTAFKRWYLKEKEPELYQNLSNIDS